MERICFNCAYCSELYPMLVDFCDINDNSIKDVFSESCENFVEVNDE